MLVLFGWLLYIVKKQNVNFKHMNFMLDELPCWRQLRVSLANTIYLNHFGCKKEFEQLMFQGSGADIVQSLNK